MANKKTPAPRRAGTETKEDMALELAREAVDRLAHDPELLGLFVVQVALLARDRVA